MDGLTRRQTAAMVDLTAAVRAVIDGRASIRVATRVCIDAGIPAGLIEEVLAPILNDLDP